MAGLYIHIPFCASRCIYCGFYSTTRHGLRQRYTDTLCRELELRRDYLDKDIHTIYIGGGTPSQMTENMLRQLFDHIDTDKATEITMECNPDDITAEYAATIGLLPINRVSMGVQTFCDNRLRFLHRRHTAADIATAVSRLRDAGIENISIDLMYGFPGETMDEWQKDIDHALALDVEHLSAYCLTIEENTPLHRMLQNGDIKENDEETCAAMYYTFIDRLAAAGYEHYEISNFARPGRRSQHNSSYWTGVPYMGIGAAAHSFNVQSRQWNVADIESYIDAIRHDELPAEKEQLDKDTQYNDTVMLRLRTCEGINLDDLSNRFGHNSLDFCRAAAQHYIDDGLLELTAQNHLRLTRRGLFISDMIMSDMMKV